MKSFVSTMVLLLALVRVVRADDPSDETKRQAKVHYQDAEQAMKDGDYAKAASEYGIAYEVIQDPILFYKIGVANQLDGKCDAAVVYFNRYIKEGKPKEDFLATVKEHIAECEGGSTTTDTGGGMIDTGTDPETLPDPDAVPDADPDADADPDTDTDAGTDTGTGEPSFLDTKPTWKKTAAWVSVAATVGFGTVGAIFLMSSRSRQEDLETLADFEDSQGLPASYDGVVQDRYETYVKEGERFRLWSEVAFAGAGVAAIAAITLFALEGKSSSGESDSVITRITPVVGPDRAGVAAVFGF